MTTVEARELAYFVAVAEERNIGRAARRLGMAQPPLSRALQQLERRLGVLLLERTNRGVELTPAGVVLLAEGRRVLDAVAAAVRRTQRAGADVPRLTLAMKPDGDAGLLERVLPRYRSEPDAVEVEVVVCGIGEQAQLLRDGRADLALLPGHDDLTGFDTEDLLVLDQVAALPRGHRLAGREALVLADLDGEPQLHDVGGPEVRDAGQLMQLVALGQLVAVVPASAQRNARSDVVFVPVLDAPTTTLVLAWPESSRSRAVAAFLRACTAAVGGDPVHGHHGLSGATAGR